MAMDHRYGFQPVPGERLAIHIESHRGAMRHVRRHACPATEGADERRGRALAARYPFANLRVLALIYGHAVGLKLAGAPLHAHPRGAA